MRSFIFCAAHQLLIGSSNLFKEDQLAITFSPIERGKDVKGKNCYWEIT